VRTAAARQRGCDSARIAEAKARPESRGKPGWRGRAGHPPLKHHCAAGVLTFRDHGGLAVRTCSKAHADLAVTCADMSANVSAVHDAARAERQLGEAVSGASPKRPAEPICAGKPRRQARRGVN